MSSRRILTVGFGLASDDTQYERIDNRLSLLDWDIILFSPTISEFYGYGDTTYQGKRCLSESRSFGLKECCEHWRREIKQAVDAGKTIIVYLPSLEEVFVDSGQRTHSGTGRNRHTTQIVVPYSNYRAIPIEIAPVNATGTSMKLVAKGAEVLAPYWAEFGGQSSYEVLLTADKVPACLTTRTGDKAVGALYRSKVSSGSLLLLPNIDFDPDEFSEEKDDELVWTSAAGKFAGKFVSAIVALDKALRSSSEITPEPDWATNSLFELGPEAELRAQLLEAERKVEEAQQKKEALSDQLTDIGRHRALLYEKGKPLEQAIIEALRLMGFTAAAFKESDSEFDVVFESAEGRLIGEAEGKDTKAVNIDKLRQLSMNIHEDFLREDVKTQAKPVLFGNGFRLQSVAERPDPFTEKCHSAAASSSTALIHTPDLFLVVQHLIEQDDAAYAQECRRTILSSVGRVTFPSVDKSEPRKKTTRASA